MNKSIVSIIVPVYNTEQYLHDCLDSLANQTYNNYEVIVVNDCSPDNSMKIIKEFIEKYPHKFSCITPKVNVGAGGARDLGIQHAKGEYLMFVDGDDFVDPLFVEIPLSIINKTSADVVQFGYKFCRSPQPTRNKHITPPEEREGGVQP